jgi:hypothetical protein
MTGMNPNESGLRGEYLVLLRHGIRQSARLAEQLSNDALVGNEARSLLGRLQAIRGELDSLATGAPDHRSAQNDPFWGHGPAPFRYSGANCR